MHKKNKHVRSSCAYAYVEVFPSEDNIRKQVCLFFLCFMLMLHAYGYAYALMKTTLKRDRVFVVISGTLIFLQQELDFTGPLPTSPLMVNSTASCFPVNYPTTLWKNTTQS